MCIMWHDNSTKKDCHNAYKKQMMNNKTLCLSCLTLLPVKTYRWPFLDFLLSIMHKLFRFSLIISFFQGQACGRTCTFTHTCKYFKVCDTVDHTHTNWNNISSIEKKILVASCKTCYFYTFSLTSLLLFTNILRFWYFFLMATDFI